MAVRTKRSDLDLLGPPVAFSVSEDGSLGDVHFASDFAEVNPGCVRGLNLLPSFKRDLSAHS